MDSCQRSLRDPYQFKFNPKKRPAFRRKDRSFFFPLENAEQRTVLCFLTANAAMGIKAQ